MQIEGHAAALREDLARIAAVGDESTGRTADLLSAALGPALTRTFLDALAEAALELSNQLEDGRVEVRVTGGDPELVYVRDDPAPAGPADEAFTARITLRLPESLKQRLEAAAAASNASVNTWLVQAIQRSLEPRASQRAGRQRLTGYGRT